MPKVITKVGTARRSPVNITPRTLALVETSADSHHKGSDSKLGGKGNKGNKTNGEKDRCQEVWKHHESATVGKIVSREFFLFFASCVDITAGFVIV